MAAERRKALTAVELARGLSKFRSSSKLSNAGMVIEADSANVQQHWALDMAGAIQQVRNELNEAVNGRLDVLSGIATAMHRTSAHPDPEPHRISDFVPRNWECSNDKGELRHFLSDLPLWMQAWSDNGEALLVNVESTDKFDINTLAVNCQQKRSSEQLRHRCTKYCAERQQMNH